MDLLFVHGGPGFNSQPERVILSEKLKKNDMNAYFWDEPSSMRGQGSPFRTKNAYENWLGSLGNAISNQRPRIVAAASFGACALLHLLGSKHRPNFNPARIVLVGPTFDLNRVFKRMMTLAEGDLNATNPEVSRRIRDYRSASRSLWDTSMREGLNLVWTDQALLTHYFVDAEIMRAWAEAMASPPYALDFESQAAVMDDFVGYEASLPKDKFTIPVSVIAGSKDPVYDEAEVKAMMQRHFEDFSCRRIERAGHFAHLERSEEFVGFLKQL
jgi:pimeloyl-ACP methyl ester carboxylesterase